MRGCAVRVLRAALYIHSGSADDRAGSIAGSADAPRREVHRAHAPRTAHMAHRRTER